MNFRWLRFHSEKVLIEPTDVLKSKKFDIDSIIICLEFSNFNFFSGKGKFSFQVLFVPEREAKTSLISRTEAGEFL